MLVSGLSPELILLCPVTDPMGVKPFFEVAFKLPTLQKLFKRHLFYIYVVKISLIKLEFKNSENNKGIEI